MLDKPGSFIFNQMKPFIVLLISFVIALAITKLINGEFDYLMAARIAMSIMLLFTSIAHFIYTRGMSMMIPGFVPFKTGMVYFTGVVEIAAAIGLLIPGLTLITGWLLMVFFILLLPANIYAAINHIDYEKATYHGKGLNYLWFRVPLQIVFIAWVYISAVQ